MAHELLFSPVHWLINVAIYKPNTAKPFVSVFAYCVVLDPVGVAQTNSQYAKSIASGALALYPIIRWPRNEHGE
jgi:hypothetical protein